MTEYSIFDRKGSRGYGGQGRKGKGYKEQME